MIWIGFSFGVLVSAVLVMIYILLLKRNNKNYLKGFINLAEDTRDRLYYFETRPVWRYRYVYPPLPDPKLNERIYENPHYLLNRVHPDDYEMLIKKINGEVDFNNPINYRIASSNPDNYDEYIWYEEFTTPIYRNGELVAIQGIVRDIQEKMRLQDELNYRMTHDTLTGVYNRDYFETSLEKYNKDVDVTVAIFICDLDKLKYVNDNLGHKVGDAYIAKAASILNEFSSEKVIVSRIGGDEFCILVVDASEDHAIALKESIFDYIKRYNEDDIEMQIEMSVGYFYFPSSIGNMDQLFIQADRSMYEDKSMRRKDYTKGIGR